MRHTLINLRLKTFSDSSAMWRSFSILLLYLLVVIPSYAQQVSIKGTVIDERGEAIIGASVVDIATKKGTVTDIDGNFTLDLPTGATIQVSYIGYHPQNLKIAAQKTLTITLVENATALEDVVVIGYGTVKKKDLTGAVSSMKSEDITIAPTSNAMEALQGKVSGMDIVKPSGQVGGDVQILLRGSRSIYGDNTPLFIIDGVPGSYNQINPSDIETIDVLKDASSTAIYGSAGANGVVIITTKRGSEKKATVNFDAYYGFSGSPKFSHGMTGDEWTNYQREAYKYLNGQYPADMSAILTNADKLNAYNSGQWIDWVDLASGNTAVNQKYNLSVTAGNAKTKVFGSLVYDSQEGLLKNEDLNRYAMRLNIDQEIYSWAKVGFTSNISHSITNRGVKNTFTKSLSSFPLGNAYDKDGNIQYEFAPNEYSPLGDFIKNQFVDNTRNTYINANAYVELTPLKGLSYKSIISATLNDSRRGQFWGNQSNANRPTYAGSPHAEVTNSNANSYMWDNVLSYNKVINKDHNITGTLISSWTKKQDESYLSGGSGQFLDSWSFYRLLGATSARIESSYEQTQKMSYAARVNYSYKGKYLLTASNRWDGVSWFSQGYKWDSFPAGALAWRISEESFMESTKGWLDNLKLRVSYGITGNAGGVAAYATSTNAYAYSSAGISLDGKAVPFTQYTGTYPSSDLGWEKTYGTNIGADITILGGKIDASVEYFHIKTNGLLYKRIMPITSGATGWGAPLTRWENIAETGNNGIEATINTHNFDTPDFKWNTTLTFTWSTEKIKSLPSGDLISESLLVGEAVRSFYGYKYKGIWSSNTPQSELDAYGVKPGWVKIETLDQNGDGGVHKYGEKDRQILGHANPDYIFGLNNTFIYKDFDFTVFAMARYGQTIKSDLLGWYSAKSGDSNNQISGVNYWTEDNQSAYFPVPGSGSEQSTVYSALQYRDGSFIKIKNITLGYTLPLRISKIAKMERCRFYSTIYNPFVFVKDKQLKGTDPETGGSDAFPLYKQFVFGVNITF